jgi:hypothetical protein
MLDVVNTDRGSNRGVSADALRENPNDWANIEAFEVPKALNTIVP